MPTKTQLLRNVRSAFHAVRHPGWRFLDNKPLRGVCYMLVDPEEELLKQAVSDQTPWTELDAAALARFCPHILNTPGEIFRFFLPALIVYTLEEQEEFGYSREIVCSYFANAKNRPLFWNQLLALSVSQRTALTDFLRYLRGQEWTSEQEMGGGLQETIDLLAPDG